VQLFGFLCPPTYRGNMASSGSDAGRWREWLRSVVDSLRRLEGESGLEFCESAALIVGQELKEHQPAAKTVAELIVAGAVAAFQSAGAEAYVDLARPRAEIEQVLRDRLEGVYRESESWVADGLSEGEIAGKLASYEVEIERSNAQVAEAVPEAKRKRSAGINFEELLAAQGSETRMVIFEIARVVSSELFSFMLSVPSSSVHDHIPSDTQREVIGELIAVLKSLPGYPYELKRGAISDALIKYQPALGTSRATHFHVKCGGARPDLSDDGTLASALKIVAMDFVGARLLAESAHTNVLASHPLYEELIYRVMSDDEPIADLFRRTAAADTNLGEAERQLRAHHLLNVIAHWSDGSGGSMDIRQVPSALLSSLTLRCDTSDDVLQQVCDAADSSLAQARQLASGEPATTVAFVGLANITLGDDVARIELPDMVIRRPSAFEHGGVPFAQKPTAIAEVTTQLRMLDVVAQSMRPTDDPMEHLREFSAERNRLSTHNKERRELSESIAERILQLRFAMTLASQQRRLLGPIWLYTVFRNPLRGWGGNSLRPSNDIASPFAKQTIDRITAERIGKYFVPTASLHPSLRLARDRILQAVSERSDHIDTFIDFVIAWESIVGYSESTTFLVSGAMSMLLSPDDLEKRRDLFSKIKKFYGHRSALVHGSAGRDATTTKSFKVTEVQDHAHQAGRLAIDAFKRVLERSDLLNLDAQERVRMILLGFPK
jgi:Apea-like HEPN